MTQSDPRAEAAPSRAERIEAAALDFVEKRKTWDRTWDTSARRREHAAYLLLRDALALPPAEAEQQDTEGASGAALSGNQDRADSEIEPDERQGEGVDPQGRREQGLGGRDAVRPSGAQRSERPRGAGHDQEDAGDVAAPEGASGPDASGRPSVPMER